MGNNFTDKKWEMWPGSGKPVIVFLVFLTFVCKTFADKCMEN